MPAKVQRVFVLMLENRSFDHMLGFSGIIGKDAATGSATQIHGLSPLALRPVLEAFQTNSMGGIVMKEGQTWPPAQPISVRALLTSNVFKGQSYGVQEGADFAMSIDPGHEFTDVVVQLCGPGAVYQFGGAYPPVLIRGFVDSYVTACVAKKIQSDPGEIMKSYNTPNQLPVLNKLAQEFVACDNWHASLPGPTWPNRFFAHAASSGGLDHSPSTLDIAKWDTIDGFDFANGTIFDRLNSKGIKWRLYAGDDFPVVAALHGINLTEINDYSDFASDVAQANYPASYTFIEPSYGHFWSDYKCGTSQHPQDDVTRGESLIKATYETIRNSPMWNSSLFIITWDEHGGFYDHLPPPPAIAPADTAPGDEYNQYGFTFQQYGPRVPALVISPLIPRNLIDHRVYDHASIPATLEACFGLNSLTQRDAQSNNLMPLVSLGSPRADAPPTLPAPASSGLTGCDPVVFDLRIQAPPVGQPMPIGPVSRPEDSFNEGNIPGFLFVVLRSHLALSPPAERPAVIGRFNAIKTRTDAAAYVSEVKPKVRLARMQLSRGPK
jgi:phospholipase C